MSTGKTIGELFEDVRGDADSVELSPGLVVSITAIGRILVNGQEPGGVAVGTLEEALKALRSASETKYVGPGENPAGLKRRVYFFGSVEFRLRKASIWASVKKIFFPIWTVPISPPLMSLQRVVLPMRRKAMASGTERSFPWGVIPA